MGPGPAEPLWLCIVPGSTKSSTSTVRVNATTKRAPRKVRPRTGARPEAIFRPAAGLNPSGSSGPGGLSAPPEKWRDNHSLSLARPLALLLPAELRYHPVRGSPALWGPGHRRKPGSPGRVRRGALCRNARGGPGYSRCRPPLPPAPLPVFSRPGSAALPGRPPRGQARTALRRSATVEKCTGSCAGIFRIYIL